MTKQKQNAIEDAAIRYGEAIFVATKLRANGRKHPKADQAVRDNAAQVLRLLYDVEPTPENVNAWIPG